MRPKNTIYIEDNECNIVNEFGKLNMIIPNVLNYYYDNDDFVIEYAVYDDKTDTTEVITEKFLLEDYNVCIK